MKNILITGWTWYIWSHAAVAFIQKWYNVIIVDSLVNSSEKVLDKIYEITDVRPIFYNLDLRDKDLLENIFKSHNIDWVIHFAALKAVWESCQDPISYYDNNINWTISLLDLMLKYSVNKIVFSSSATVYSSENNSPLKETDSLDCTNPYGYTKLVIEKLLKWITDHKPLKSICLRYFNPIWAHSSWLIGETPNWIPNNLLPYIMDVVSWKRELLNVYGNDYDTYDWTWVRDYIHIQDLIQWHLGAYTLLENTGIDKYFDVFNLGTGNWTSVLDMIKMTQDITWKEIKYKVVPRRAWDLAQVYCDPKKANEILWWKAVYDVNQAIKDSYNFILKSISY